MDSPKLGSGQDSGLLASAVRVVSGLTLLSRFSGLARDLITARLFGDGLLGSAFRAAYAAPNLFRRLFGEGALSAAFIPEYTRGITTDRQTADALASMVIAWLTMVTSALVVVIEIALIGLMLLKPDPERTLSLQLMLVMLPMMPMVCLTAILGGMLQSHGKFGPPAAAPILLNLFQVGAAGVCWVINIDRTVAAYATGVAAVAASIAQIAWSLHALRGRVSWTRAWSGASESAKTVLSRFLPVVIGLGTLQLNTMLDTLIAMWPTWVGPTMFGKPTPLDASSNAILSYTQTLYQFPLGVFGLAVATAVFPMLSRVADDRDAFTSVIRKGLRLSFFIGAPASIGLFAVREDICHVLFGGKYGGFNPANIDRCAATLSGFALAVWAYSLNHVFTRAFYARGDTRTPMRLAMSMVALNLTLNLTLIWSFKESGMAYATGVSAVVQCLVLGILCRRKLDIRSFDGETARSFVRIIACGITMFAGIELADRVLGVSESWTRHVIALVTKVTVGTGCYGLLCVILKTPELKWLMQRAPGGSKGPSSMSFE